MAIRKAALEDVAEIMEIYAGARRFMVENGNPDQWASRNWPPEELIRENIADGSLFVLVDDPQTKPPDSEKNAAPADRTQRIDAVFCVEYGAHVEPCYDTIEGAWTDDSPYAVVHHMAAAAPGTGAGRKCISWVCENYGHVRLDTHEANKFMQKLARSLGFRYCGIVYIGNGDLRRLAFERC